MRWWERHPDILAREFSALAELGLDFKVDEAERDAGRMVLRGSAPAGRLGIIDVAVVYPGSFPHTRPAVFQTSPGEPLGRHQNPFERNYCLIGRSSDHWDPSMTAADLVAGLPRLVELVDAGGQALVDAEDPQGEPITAYYVGVSNGCVLIPPMDGAIPPEVSGGTVVVGFADDSTWLQEAMRGRDDPPLGQAVLIEVRDLDGTVLASAAEPVAARFDGETWSGKWVRIPPDDPPPPDPAGFGHHLARLGPHLSRMPEQHRRKWKFEIHAGLFHEEVRQGEFEDAWMFLAHAHRGQKHQPNQLAVPVKAQRLTPDSLGERIRHVAALRDATVATVGLGTLGAPLAQRLAQAQTGTMLVADFDVFDVGTAVRWPYGLPAAGVDKARYLADELCRHYPFVTVSPVTLRLGAVSPPGVDSRESDDVTLARLVDEADLVIDATAEDNASRAIAEAATRAGKPQLYVWSVDGYGGVVASIRPGLTGCYHCLSVALSDGGSIPPPPAAADAAATRTQPRGCADPTFVATAVDLLPLVDQAARVAMSRLANDGYGHVPGDVFVLALRHPDGTPLAVPEWRAHDLPPSPDCWYCSLAP
jgi:molybdopterin/thiamine biosynthesis adenylyltransferase